MNCNGICDLATLTKALPKAKTKAHSNVYTIARKQLFFFCHVPNLIHVNKNAKKYLINGLLSNPSVLT